MHKEWPKHHVSNAICRHQMLACIGSTKFGDRIAAVKQMEAKVKRQEAWYQLQAERQHHERDATLEMQGSNLSNIKRLFLVQCWP